VARAKPRKWLCSNPLLTFRIASLNKDSQDRAFRNVRPAVGRRLDEAMRIIWPEPLATDLTDIFRHTLATGEPYHSTDFVSPRADTGQKEGYEWELHRITLSDGRPGVVCYYFDATKLRQAEHELKEADRKKDEFLATLAHELRNPLAPLRNALSILSISPDPNALDRLKEMMTRQVNQMVRLIDDLLDVSRINRGKLELRMEQVELVLIINHAVESCRPMADGSNHTVTVTLPPQPLVLSADPIRLAQVFTNLLNNSCKFTKDGGRISMSVERQGRDVVVAVKDDGIGIPPDKIDGIFEMFSQVDRTLEKSEGGLGIGLALVKRLVELHGGSIEARSEGLGKGSEFIVRLPVDVEHQSLPDEPVEAIRPSASRRILVVDDNRDSADTLVMLLRLSGNETFAAHDGEEAVEVAAKNRPDVILLDIGLPKLNGYDACRRIREQQWAKNIAVIALTGWGQDEDRRKSSEAGFSGHMVKPVDHAALMKLLATLFADVESQPIER